MASKSESSKQNYATATVVVGYALCSSMLAVINKYAITKFNYPGLMTALQYLTSVLGVWVFGKLGLLHHDPFVWETAKKFMPAAFVFYLAIFTNTNLLKHANVDTWGFVLYNNLLSLMLAPVFWILTGEYVEVYSAAMNAGVGGMLRYDSIVAVGLSCVFGLAISFFGFAARKAVTATAFTVTGVVNKFLTVVINVLIWDKHASAVGLIFLLMTIVGGVLYQQSVTIAVAPQHDSGMSKQMEGVKDHEHADLSDEEKSLMKKSSGF